MNDLHPIIWDPAETPPDVACLLQVEAEEFPIFAQGKGEGTLLAFHRGEGDDSSVEMSEKDGGLSITYSSLAGAARGIGAALAGMTECRESAPFSMLGFMLDVSRGMVMTPEHLKQWMRRLALGGCTFAMLYCEDTFVLPNEPMFGYMRGGYTSEDLQELDRYAASLGIELCGCCQTLAHMEQVLKWPVYANVKDTANVLLVDEEKTYELIEKIIRFWSESLKSRRIHIGMDEAMGMGLGNFLKKNGLQRGFDIVNRHLGRVNEICRKYGLKPMIWGDMYFRYGNASGRYYDLESKIPQDVVQAIPKGVQLVYWDYYNGGDIVSGMIAKHREIGCEPVMGSGVWTWAQPWYNHVMTNHTVVPCIEACRKAKLRELFFTLWGDDGAYCNYDSCLSGLFFAMDLAYGISDEEKTARRFDAICRSDYRATIAVSRIYERVEGVMPLSYECGWLNPAALLWDDPLEAMMYDEAKRDNPEFANILINRYQAVRKELQGLENVDGAADFKYADGMMRALIDKLQCRFDFEKAYDQKDRDALMRVLDADLPAAIASMEAFMMLYRNQWLKAARPFGLEVTQIRYAGQIERLKEFGRRLQEYLEGKVESIPEMEARLQVGSAPQKQVQSLRYFGVSSGMKI